MPTRRAELRHAALLLLAAAAAAGAALLSGSTGAARPVFLAPATPQAWRGLVGSRPRVSVGRRMIVVLRTPSLSQHVRRDPTASRRRERRWTAAAQTAQQLLLARLSAEGVTLHPELSFTRVLDGFSAALDPSSVPVVERDKDVAGVYPVRAAFPATLSVSSSAVDVTALPQLAAPGLDGHGVRVALLDTGVDPAVPSLHGRVLPGVDVLGGDPGALAAVSPDDPSSVERHGTETAGLVVRIAPGASILPIRVAGWQPDALGHFAIYARSDQLLAGLDRAVDPNGDGDAHDAAQVALVALAEPFAAFADGPEARAVLGALDLGTLVVAAAGNDGPAAASYGDVSAPAAAPAALAVGAIDTRPTTTRVRVVVRTGLSTLFDATEALAGSAAPSGTLSLEVSAPRTLVAGLSGYFSSAGDALVAGRAALVPASASPAPAAEQAAAAGAAAVLLYGGGGLPAGGLGLDTATPVPVISLPEKVGRSLIAALAGGRPASVVIERAGDAANIELGRVASFSSTGLAFDGRVKPDLVAPGVGLLTTDPGENADGSPRLLSVNGSSAAAATVAGAAALVVQARSELSATDIRGLLVAGAQAIPNEPVTVQGAGAIDVQASLRAQVVSAPATLALSRAGTASFILTNVSARTERLSVSGLTQEVGAASVRVAVQPASLALSPGERARVRVVVTASAAPVGSAPTTGAIVVRTAAGAALRVPWAIGFGQAAAPLLEHVSLSKRRFAPSDVAPALLSLDAGRVLQLDGVTAVRPLARLDVVLLPMHGAGGGLLARIRDVLPGRYTFGLTGRGPDGTRLPPGRYTVRVLAYPVAGGPPNRSDVRFTLR